MGEKYKLDNIIWFYSLEDKKLVPVYINSEKTKAKDLKTSKVYDLKENFANNLANDYNCSSMKMMKSAKIANICFNKYDLRGVAKEYIDYFYGRPSKEEIENAIYSSNEIKRLIKKIEKVFYDKMKVVEKENEI